MDIQRIVMTGPREVDIAQESLSEDGLAPHEVVLRTQFSLISPGTELAHFAGNADPGRHISERPYPWFPGYAAVGTVLAAGADAGVREGESVIAHTGHQSVARFDARQCVCVRVPDGIPLHTATMARLGQVSAVAMRAGAVRAGDWAAVIGLGLVGLCAAQLLQAAGMQVVGADPLLERRALATRYGSALTIDPRDATSMDAASAVSGGGCRLVLECSGQPRGVETALALAASYGEVALVGAAWRNDTEVLATAIIRPIFDKFLTLRSGWEWQIPRYGADAADSIAACTTWVLACIQDGRLDAQALITDMVAPSGVAEAYRQLLDEPTAHLGVVIDWTGTMSGA